LAIGDIIVGIDIGTSKVSIVIGEINKFNQIETVCTYACECAGIKKCKIINSEDIIKGIKKAVTEAEKQANIKINSAYINIPGKHITIVQNSISRQTKDIYAGISLKDVQVAIMQSKDIDIPEDKVLIDLMLDKFILDNGKELEDPVGQLSSNFTLNAQIVLADKEYIKEITNIVKKAGIELDGIVPNVVAERSFILDANETNDRVMVLDIGASNTEIGVFEGNTLIYANTITLGGDNITSDISQVLEISYDEADKLKKQYGLALKSFIDNDNNIILNTYKTGNKTIKSSELIEIIEARVEEIFSLVSKEIQAKGLKSKINNVIITGLGITSIAKSDVSAKIILGIPVKIATGRMTSVVKPTYSAAYSIVRYIGSRPFAKTVSSSVDTMGEETHVLRNVLEKVKDFFYS